jgi:hypothetical protein
MSEALARLAEWARASLRDEIGPSAAKVVMAIDQDVLLYGAMQRSTLGAYLELDDHDRDRVRAVCEVVWP